MVVPQPAMILPRELVHGAIALSTKPTASIHYTFARGNDVRHNPRWLVIFLNGLMSDKSAWLAVMGAIIRQHTDQGFPSMLAYDRYGQGLTEDRDPQDQGKPKGYGHDLADVVQDLHQLVTQIVAEKINSSPDELRLILVANSIGCPIARLYAQAHPGLVAGLLLLDSMMANSNFDWWPDPDAEGFDSNELPADVTVPVLREQRAKFAAIFAPDVVNKEGLDRRYVADLLPESDQPQLIGPGGNKPLVTVVGHDPHQFAIESLQSMGTPVSMSMKYTTPVWRQYNEGLLKITDAKMADGPVIATGCGHFVQRDDPNFVVAQLSSMLKKLEIWPQMSGLKS